MMNNDLLDIQPKELLDIKPNELKFIFELKKQSSCTVRLVNKSNHHVAFKVKTTSPKKYCVRPNTGVIEPKSTCDFTVTMQAQRVTPPDLICKDKFLIQSTAVPAGTTDDEITTVTFGKDAGKYVEEKKLRVILVSPPNSPVISPINGTLKPLETYGAKILEEEVVNGVETQKPPLKVIGDFIHVDEDSDESNVENSEEREPVKISEYEKVKDEEEQKLSSTVEEIKSKVKELESKLCEAGSTISKLTEEKRSSIQDRDFLRKELEMLKSKRAVSRQVQVGFPLLFVCWVAIMGLYLGYSLRR